MTFAETHSKLQESMFAHRSENDDLEDNESDTTKVFMTAESFDKAHLLPFRLNPNPSDSISARTRLAKRVKELDNFWTWLRWGVIVGLQTTLILLISVNHGKDRSLRDTQKDSTLGDRVVETGGDINGLYKTLSHSYTFLKPEEDKYIPNMTTNDNRMEVRRNWDLLMPLGSGSVLIPNYRDYPLLGSPIIDDPIRSGPLFEASWTHAMHCLYYTVDSYHQLVLNGPSENDNPYHASHCFEYLRNSILCNLDMTLEGSMSTLDDKDRGQAHVCRNREEAIAWIEARRGDDAQDIIGP